MAESGGPGDLAMKWQTRATWRLGVTAGAAAFLLINLAVPAFSEVDLFLAARVEQEMARGAPAAGFALLEDAIRSPDTTPEEKVSLLQELARLRLDHENFADAGEAFSLQADLIARLEGATAPELAGVYVAAADAYARANDSARALSLAEDALRIDSAYYDCNAEMIARDHLRIAIIVRRVDPQGVFSKRQRPRGIVCPGISVRRRHVDASKLGGGCPFEPRDQVGLKRKCFTRVGEVLVVQAEPRQLLKQRDFLLRSRVGAANSILEQCETGCGRAASHFLLHTGCKEEVDLGKGRNSQIYQQKRGSAGCNAEAPGRSSLPFHRQIPWPTRLGHISPGPRPQSSPWLEAADRFRLPNNQPIRLKWARGSGEGWSQKWRTFQVLNEDRGDAAARPAARASGRNCRPDHAGPRSGGPWRQFPAFGEAERAGLRSLPEPQASR